MKPIIAAIAFGITFLCASTGFAAQHEMPKGDTNATAPAQGPSAKKDAAKRAKEANRKRCPRGQIYNKKQKKCVARPAKGATPAAPAEPAAPATPAQ